MNKKYNLKITLYKECPPPEGGVTIVHKHTGY